MRQGGESKQAWQDETSALGFWSLLSFNNLGISGLITEREMGNRVGETGKPQGRSGGGQEVPAIPAVPAGISAVLCGGFCTFMTLLGPEACLEHLLRVPQPSSFQHSRVWEHPHGTGMFLWTWIRCFRTGSSFPVGQTWNPGNGVKSSRTCSPVGAIIPKGLVVLWDVIPTGGRALSFPGLFAGACSEQLLHWE